jgi:phage terminase large subunit-like protein
MSAEPVCPAYALAHCGHDVLAALTDVERFVLPHMVEVWLRPEQRFPAGAWSSVGFICGRGWGKTKAIARFMNSEIEAGRVRSPALMGPTVDRVDEVQIQALIDESVPWFRPERFGGTIRWPNGVTIEIHTAEVKDAGRGSNIDFLWLCEIVAWAPATRAKAFQSITTATREPGARTVWDTTSEGSNEIIDALEAAHEAEPDRHHIVRGTTFDNPLLSAGYLRDEVRKYAGQPQRLYEELFGEVFRGAAGALWTGDVLRDTRVAARPARPALTIVAVDPALTVSAYSDETGIVVGDRGQDGHSYVHADESGRHTIDAWTGIVVDWCELRGAAGFVIEVNRLHENAAHPIISEARTRTPPLECVKLKHDEPFPPRQPGVIWYREVVAASSKGTRAQGPSAEYANSAAHIVGALAKLEYELKTYVPGVHGQKSPNRFDAHTYLVTELAGLAHDRPGARVTKNAHAAANMTAQINAGLLAAARGRRVGL